MSRFIVPIGFTPDEYVINGVKYIVSSHYQKPNFRDTKQNSVINNCIGRYLTSDFADLTIVDSSDTMAAEYDCSAAGEED